MSARPIFVQGLRPHVSSFYVCCFCFEAGPPGRATPLGGPRTWARWRGGGFCDDVIIPNGRWSDISIERLGYSVECGATPNPCLTYPGNQEEHPRMQVYFRKGEPIVCLAFMTCQVSGPFSHICHQIRVARLCLADLAHAREPSTVGRHSCEVPSGRTYFVFVIPLGLSRAILVTEVGERVAGAARPRARGIEERGREVVVGRKGGARRRRVSSLPAGGLQRPDRAGLKAVCTPGPEVRGGGGGAGTPPNLRFNNIAVARSGGRLP